MLLLLLLLLISLTLLPVLPPSASLSLVVVVVPPSATASPSASSTSTTTASAAVHRATVVGIVSAGTLMRWAVPRPAVLSAGDHAAVNLGHSVGTGVVGATGHYHLRRISAHLLRHVSMGERRRAVGVGGSGELLRMLRLRRRRRRFDG